MIRRVRIKSVPKARTGYQVQGALANDVPAFGGADYNAYIGKKPSEVKKTISAVPREMANLEAEGGETVIGNIDGSMMPSFFTITGPRHSSGGVPLNLPDDSFIFSDTKSMKITDPAILKMFNANPKKGGYTPADLSKKYDLNKYRKILQDPNSDKMDRKTAEMMIKNYTMKLGALALAQESKKGFPQGIPELSKPYMEANSISEEDILPEKKEEQQEQPEQEMAESPEMQQQEGEEGMPMEMPNGEQIAQPQSMEQEQMEMPQGEMMQLGGFPGPYAVPQEYWFDDPNKRAAYDANTRKGAARIRDNNNDPDAERDYGRLADSYSPNGPNLDLPAEMNTLNQKYPFSEGFSEVPFIGGKNNKGWDKVRAEKPAKDKSYKQMDPNSEYMGDPYKQVGGVLDQDYTFPYHPTEMAYGGYLPKAQNGKSSREMTDAELEAQRQKRKDIEKIKGKKCPPGYRLLNGYCQKGNISSQEEKAVWQKRTGPLDMSKNEAYKKSMCTALQSGEYKGKTAQWLADGNKIAQSAVADLQKCENKEEIAKKSSTEDYDVKQLISDDCPCKDDKGVDIPGKFAQKDPTTGECKPETCKPVERCECEDGTDPGMNDDGTCKDCGEEEVIEEGQMAQERKDPEWWLQDSVNTLGAFGDAMSLKKYMPWEARVDLEEPRPTFLDPTRELAAQSEQANIAAQAASSFAGPQALNARLSQTQGQAAAQAANTLSNINNQNVNIANQFEANQVGVRNQENMLNQQMANRVYDKNVVANQQFDNAKRQAAANTRQQYNAAVTNRWKTDAMNQMYPNYQVGPGSGGRVDYTPTEKQVDPGAKTSTYGEKLKDLMSQGFSRETAEKMIMNEHKATYSKKGGSTPGYIYTDWPIFL